jgi:uncharacterized Zn finger protein (UPF0148 family)
MTEAVCPRCKYRWKRRGKLMRVKCPNCAKDFQLNEVKKDG